MELKVIGVGCERCTILYENTRKAAAILGLDATIEKVEDLTEMVRLQVTGLPAVMADGIFIVTGQEVCVEELVELLRGEDAAHAK